MRTLFRAVVPAALLILAGCSGQATVSGRVTLDGQPLTSGMVTFHPVDGGPLGVGSIDSSGRYSVSVGTSKTLPPGEYIITVEATETLTGQPMDSSGKPLPPKAPKRLTPDRYAIKERTDLKRTITSGSNTVDLELTK